MSIRVILLGHRGLLGAAFARHLRLLGAEVIGLDSTNYETARGMRSDVVLNADGSSDRRLAENDPLRSFQLNDEVTLASLVELPTDLYLHVSSVGVYAAHPGDRGRNVEDTVLDPLAMTNYGRFKWIGELLVRSHAKRWVIARVGPVVGPGLRKNSVFDLLEQRTLFCSPASKMPYIDTRSVARMVWELRGEDGEIFNIAGDGDVRLDELAHELGVELDPSLAALPRDDWSIDVSKLRTRMPVPRAWDEVRRFVAEWRGQGPMPGPK